MVARSCQTQKRRQGSSRQSTQKCSQHLRSCRVLNGDGLLSRSAVASIVCRSERPNNGVVAGSVASDGLETPQSSLAAVVRRSRVVKDQVVRALRSVVSWDAQLRSCRVLNGDGLLSRSAVASIVCRSERANNGVVAGSVASDGLARHLNRHFAAVVRRRSVVKDQVVRALRSVVRWDAQLWSCRVLNGDRLLS